MSEQEPFVLRCPAGEYSAPSLGRLLWEIVKHRTWHLLLGDGWVD